MQTGKKVAQKIRNANCKKVAQKMRNANWKKVAKKEMQTGKKLPKGALTRSVKMQATCPLLGLSLSQPAEINHL